MSESRSEKFYERHFTAEQSVLAWGTGIKKEGDSARAPNEPVGCKNIINNTLLFKGSYFKNSVFGIHND
jgi:hypothetical protein